MYYRIRIITEEKRILVGDKSFSQVVEMLNNTTPEQREDFWNKREVLLPTGCSVFLIREGV